METLLTHSASEAAALIRKGGVVAFPTETVYGLGANVFDVQAIKEIFRAKRRPTDNPLIAHIGEMGQIELLASEISAEAHMFMHEFFPGPLTIVLNKNEKVPMAATADLNSIGIRMPRNELAQEFLKACGTPVVAPSANLSGRPSPTTWQAVYEDLKGRIDCILQGDPTEIGLESTVIDCTSRHPVVLRLGAISLEQLRKVVPMTRASDDTATDRPRSPGLKHRHYSPAARVVIAVSDIKPEPEKKAAYIGVDAPIHRFAEVLTLSDVDAYAHSVFEFFRQCDRNEIQIIYCESVPETGIGAALMDRLRRAAEAS